MHDATQVYQKREIMEITVIVPQPSLPVVTIPAICAWAEQSAELAANSNYLSKTHCLAVKKAQINP
jgi:hypothetical protein